MKRWRVIPICLATLSSVLAVCGTVDAYDPLEGLTPVKIGVCASRDGPQPCAIAVKEGEPDNTYIVIFNDDGEPVLVLKHDNATGRQEKVWSASDTVTEK